MDYIGFLIEAVPASILVTCLGGPFCEKTETAAECAAFSKNEYVATKLDLGISFIPFWVSFGLLASLFGVCGDLL